MKHGQRVDINRDIVGLSGANIAAGLTGTFVVNGSPTKTEILDEQKGRTQLANITMSLVVLVVVLFLTGFLTEHADGRARRDRVPHRPRPGRHRRSAADPCGPGERVPHRLRHRRGGVRVGRRAGHHPGDRRLDPRAGPPGVLAQGLPRRGGPGRRAHLHRRRPLARRASPGLLVFRFDAQLFYANASLFVDDIQSLIAAAPTPVRWLVLDCSSPSTTSTTPPDSTSPDSSRPSTPRTGSSPSPTWTQRCWRRCATTARSTTSTTRTSSARSATPFVRSSPMHRHLPREAASAGGPSRRRTP